MRRFFIFVFFISSLSLIELRGNGNLKILSKYSTKVPEPSDVYYHKENNSLFIVSDEGALYETTLNGEIIRKAEYEGNDFEAVWSHNGTLFVVDESLRQFLSFSHESLALKNRSVVPYSGARNEGFESLVFNPVKDCFVSITEKNPALIFELSSQFKTKNIIEPPKEIKEVSSATYHKDHIWLLSDAKRTVYKCNPETYSVVSQFKVPVINPEGLAFIPDGRLLVLSDDMEKLFYFNSPE